MKKPTDKEKFRAAFIVIGSLVAMNGLLAFGVAAETATKDAKYCGKWMADELEKELNDLFTGFGNT